MLRTNVAGTAEKDHNLATRVHRTGYPPLAAIYDELGIFDERVGKKFEDNATQDRNWHSLHTSSPSLSIRQSILVASEEAIRGSVIA
jgi:hypothetical protein